MIATIADYSPGTVQVLAVIAAAVFFAAVIDAFVHPFVSILGLLAAGLTLLAVAVIFLV